MGGTMENGYQLISVTRKLIWSITEILRLEISMGGIMEHDYQLNTADYKLVWLYLIKWP
jgi:hypothetical protein